MANSEHLDILRQGTKSWNSWKRENIYVIPDLSGADLSDVDLVSANLNGANLIQANLFDAYLNGADLSGADLSGADLSNADLNDAFLSKTNLNKANLNRTNLTDAHFQEADLSEAQLISADLINTNLSTANLSRANLSNANLCRADFSRTNLNEADLNGANLFKVNLSEANLSGTRLTKANLRNINLDKALLHGALLGWTIFVRSDLSGVIGLEEVVHKGPSTIGIDTIQQSQGKISGVFLRRCGLSPWEIEITRLYDLNLASEMISKILNESLFMARTEGNIFSGGIFISCSPSDSGFADKLYQSLDAAGASVWVDNHDSSDADMQGVIREMRMCDISLIVLSENSINSDWIEGELEMARAKEQEESFEMIYPVSLDDSWRIKTESNTLWRYLEKKNVLDFPEWETAKFEPQFNELVDSFKIKRENES
ncbi:MAG: toll/interleukin-1 receptor domain-containing protein [Dehalococcoidia bacterium]